MNTARWWCRSKKWVNLGIDPDDILECDASWYVPVIGAIMRQLLKFPMRWRSGADRDQPWLARSLPVDCRATDGTLRWGGHYEMLPVERPRKHAAMRWALQMFSRRGAALPLLDVYPEQGRRRARANLVRLRMQEN